MLTALWFTGGIRMRAAALVILATVGAGAAIGKDWTFEAFPNPDWGYRVQVPYRERARKDTRVARYGPDPAQSTASHTATFTPSGADVVLTVTVVEIPPALGGVSPAVLYEGARRGLLGPTGFGMIPSAPEADVDCPVLSGGSAKGKAYRLFDGKHHVRARVVAHDGRLYQLTAVGIDQAAVTGKVASEFLTGLVLTGRGKP